MFVLMNKCPDRPVRVHVTERFEHRDQPDLGGCGHLLSALIPHLQRIACEGARAAWCRAPAAQDWLESETGLKGWRAQINPDTAHLIHVIEELGIAEFDDA